MRFEELLNRIAPKLKGIAYKLHRSSCLLDEDDLYQEAVSHLWGGYQDGKLNDKTDSYVLQGCYFYLQNYIRVAQEKASLISANTPVNEGGVELEDVLPAEEESATDEGPNIDTLMEKIFKYGLSRKEKEVAFFYLQGWTTRKIGERLGMSHVSVLKLENKIREKCKRLKNSVTNT